jgi:hypothetical protein
VIGAGSYWPGYEYVNQFKGYINSIRVHGGALSPGDVWVNYLLGPVQWQGIGILTQPADLLVPEPGDGVLSVVADGAGPFSYQWYRAGAPLAGATISSCTLTDLRFADSGSQFFCVVTSPDTCPSCTATSRIATVTVQPQVPVISRCLAVPQKERVYIHFSAVIGDRYRVDYTEQLSPPNWTQVAPAQTAADTALEVTDVLTYHQRFYRVVHLP